MGGASNNHRPQSLGAVVTHVKFRKASGPLVAAGNGQHPQPEKQR